MKIQWLIFKNFYLFSVRHLRYLKISFILYLLTFINPRKAHFQRLGFCFLQLIDDILDGDRKIDGEPLTLITQLELCIHKQVFDSSELHFIARAYWQSALKMKMKNPDEIYAATLAVIKNMKLDRERVLERKLLSAQELTQQHRETFEHSLNLCLLANECTLRAQLLPELLDLFGWTSTMRDLHEDISKGLINIPKEICETAFNNSPYEPLLILNDLKVQNWLLEQNHQAAQNIETLRFKIELLKNESGYAIFKLFFKSMESFYKKGAFLNPAALKPLPLKTKIEVG